MAISNIPYRTKSGKDISKEFQAKGWGNNAAWICYGDGCSNLLGARTSGSKLKNRTTTIKCLCGKKYIIERGKNKKGKYRLGRALGIREI